MVASESWSPVNASSSEGGCGDKLNEEITKQSRTLQNLRRDHEVNENVIRLFWYQASDSLDHTQTLAYRCFPDTVDPRGPKGK